METIARGKPQTFILYAKNTAIAKNNIIGNQPSVVYKHAGSSAESGAGIPYVSAISISACRASATKRALSPVITSIRQTASNSIR